MYSYTLTTYVNNVIIHLVFWIDKHTITISLNSMKERNRKKTPQCTLSTRLKCPYFRNNPLQHNTFRTFEKKTCNVHFIMSLTLIHWDMDKINSIPALVQIMAWCRPGDKPLSEPVMVSFLTHIYASLGLGELRGFLEPERLDGL